MDLTPTCWRNVPAYGVVVADSRLYYLGEHAGVLMTPGGLTFVALSNGNPLEVDPAAPVLLVGYSDVEAVGNLLAAGFTVEGLAS